MSSFAHVCEGPPKICDCADCMHYKHADCTDTCLVYCTYGLHSTSLVHVLVKRSHTFSFFSPCCSAKYNKGGVLLAVVRSQSCFLLRKRVLCLCAGLQLSASSSVLRYEQSSSCQVNVSNIPGSYNISVCCWGLWGVPPGVFKEFRK